jgi:putative spermidine/putrescine transport system permease protein
VQFIANAAQRTLPLEMFTGLREQLSTAITAAATLVMGLFIMLPVSCIFGYISCATPSAVV